MYCGAIMPDGISPFLKVYITSERDMVVGYIGDGSTASLSSMWQSPFENQSVGGLLGQISEAARSAGGIIQTATGTTSKSVLNSMLVWEGQQPPEFSLTIDFLATTDAYIEVNSAISALLQMESPELNDIAPLGRRPQTVVLDIGRRLKLMDVVIKDVSYLLDAPRTPSGHFTQNTVTLQCSGNTSVNRSDIPFMFI